MWYRGRLPILTPPPSTEQNKIETFTVSNASIRGLDVLVYHKCAHPCQKGKHSVNYIGMETKMSKIRNRFNLGN